MKLAAKIAATVIGTALVSGVAGLAAQSAFAATATPAPGSHAASADTSRNSQVGSAMLSNGFHVYNLSSHPIRLVNTTGENSWDGRAADGSVLQPGAGYQDFEMTWYFWRDTFDTLNYQMLGDNGNVIATFHYLLGSGGDKRADTSSEFHVDSGTIAGDANDTVMSVKDAGKPDITLNGDQAQAQADVLNQLCTDGNSATCSFALTGQQDIDGPSHVVVTETNNGPNTATLTASKGDTVSSTDSVEVSATAGAQIAGLVNIQVSAKYGHTWGQSHQFTTGVSNPVSPHSFGEITAIAPMIRDTGDFTVTLGNTTWHLTNVHFDSPNPDGAEHFGYDEHPLTPAQIAALPPTAMVNTP